VIKTTISARHWFEAMAIAAQKNPGDLFRDWLDSLEWDGVPRCDTWLQDYAGVTDGSYTRAVGSKTLIAVVARTLTPGCKVDTILTLKGRQGARKSSLFRELVGGEWFSDADIDIGSKDGAINIQGPAIIEFSELSALSRHQVEKIKAFVTRQTDKFRPPYGRVTADFPRRCIFVATTNDDHYLTDVTGNRRFWPVTVGDAIDVEGVAEARDQLFAEAVTRFKAGERWYLDTPELVALAEEEQEERFQLDPWQEVISVFLEGKDLVTMGEIFEKVLVAEGADGVRRGVPLERQSSALSRRVSQILGRLGWGRRLVTLDVGGKRRRRTWVYSPKLTTPFK